MRLPFPYFQLKRPPLRKGSTDTSVVGHIIGERKKYIFYGECYLSAIMHKKMEFGLKKSKK